MTRESSKKLIAEQIRRIGKEGGEIIYYIIQLLLKEKMEKGFTKRYSLAELQKMFPWKKSRTIEIMQEVVEKGVLKHEKRKYLLNKENKLVKRIWNYYNEPSYQEKEKIEDIRKLIHKKKKLEFELEKEEKKSIRKYKEMMKKEDEEYGIKIMEEFTDGMNPKEFIMKNILEALGYKKYETRK